VRESVIAVRMVLGHRLLRVTMLTAMAANLVLATVLSTLAAVVGSIYHHDPRTASLITSTGGVVSLLAILLTPLMMRRFGYARCLWTMAVATGLVCVVATFSSSVLLFAALLTVAYLGDSVVAIVLRSVRIRVIPRDRYAALMSATAFLCFLPMPFAGFLIGALVGRFGLRFTWAAMGLLALTGVVLAWRISRSTKPIEQHEFGAGRAVLRESPVW
jgi:MFS family permease